MAFINVSTDGALMYTGFGFDPRLSDAIGAYINREIEDENITGKQVMLASAGAMIISKGRVKPKFWIKKSIYHELKGIDGSLLDKVLRSVEKVMVNSSAGANGIKKLTGSGINGRMYEIKVMGKGGAYRILGNMGGIRGKML